MSSHIFTHCICTSLDPCLSFSFHPSLFPAFSLNVSISVRLHDHLLHMYVYMSVSLDPCFSRFLSECLYQCPAIASLTICVCVCIYIYIYIFLYKVSCSMFLYLFLSECLCGCPCILSFTVYTYLDPCFVFLPLCTRLFYSSLYIINVCLFLSESL